MILRNELIEFLKQKPLGFKDKHLIRYMYKNAPELWKKILEATSFLPEDALPKQRVWHILNDVYYRPMCPVDNIEVLWWEDRYLKYSSRSAKARCPEFTKKRMETYKKRTGFDHWRKDPILTKQMEETYWKNRKTGLHKPDFKPGGRPEIQKKIKKTNLERYGVQNVFESKMFQQKAKDRKIELGLIKTDNQFSDRENYYRDVEYYTDLSWLQNFNKINPNRYVRGKGYDLDHIFSQIEGYANNIPPEIIGHWTNLQMLESKENYSKGPNCHKSLKELYEDYCREEKLGFYFLDENYLLKTVI